MMKEETMMMEEMTEEMMEETMEEMMNKLDSIIIYRVSKGRDDWVYRLFHSV